MPRKLLIQYYESNVRPIVHYGVFVYGCCSYSLFLSIYLLQKKIVKFIYFKKRTESCEDIFLKQSILTVYHLHVYELIKFSLKAISGFHCENFWNDLLFPCTIERETRGSAIKLLKQPLCKTKIERCSIKFRATKLYNKLKSLEMIPADFEAKTLGEIANFCPMLKCSFLVCNHELNRFLFDF